MPWRCRKRRDRGREQRQAPEEINKCEVTDCYSSFLSSSSTSFLSLHHLNAAHVATTHYLQSHSSCAYKLFVSLTLWLMSTHTRIQYKHRLTHTCELHTDRFECVSWPLSLWGCFSFLFTLAADLCLTCCCIFNQLLWWIDQYWLDVQIYSVIHCALPSWSTASLNYRHREWTLVSSSENCSHTLVESIVTLNAIHC